MCWHDGCTATSIDIVLLIVSIADIEIRLQCKG
jgi:hypothetical protein